MSKLLSENPVMKNVDSDGIIGAAKHKGKVIRIYEEEETTNPVREDKSMDDGYKKLVERLDADSREREERIHNQMREREERYERRSKEVEDRIIQLYGESVSQINGKLDAHEKLIESKFNTMDTKLDSMQKQVTDIHGRTRFWVNLIVPSIVAIVVGILTALISTGFFNTPPQ
ncbi:hypothetical protein [Halalkalibacter krulwichiae]|uniref:hypothetical protein n=1 Tax=Halalkalibacter krulwichiae TaxID=199441 RepID=UPI000824D77F|nr:hypothetical protein [Halalkalibacter krulwichiae]